MRLTLLAFSLLFSWFAAAQQGALLSSNLTQGGYFIGQVAPGSTVEYRGKPLRVASDGRFIIGFGRDAKTKQSYTYTLPTGVSHRVSLKLKERKYQVQRIKGVAKKYVTPAESVLGRIQNDNQQVKSARTFDTKSQDFFRGFSRPAEGPVTGVYGSQRVFNGEPRRPHFGLDIAGPVGTDILAPADGVVRLAEPDLYFSGGTIIIDHGFGISSSFLHLSQLSVKEGQKVKRGERIGEMGATGRVTGSHLDWRINWFDVRLDPALMLTAPVNSSE